MPAITVAEGGHRRNVVGIGAIGHEIVGRYGRLLAVYDLIAPGFGDDDLLAHVSNDLISHDEYRLTEAFGHVEGLDRDRVALLN